MNCADFDNRTVATIAEVNALSIVDKSREVHLRSKMGAGGFEVEVEIVEMTGTLKNTFACFPNFSQFIRQANRLPEISRTTKRRS